MKIQLLSTSALLLGSLAAPLALAQEAEETASRTLDTITVTATKREQTLQDVPVAVSVVDEEVLNQAQVLDLNDLQSLVPSLRVGQLQNSAQTNFVIRGFGNGANNAGIEPSVGVFIDGVFRSRSAAAISDLPNLQRVEVLRGPQSTLFGKNASAGVISVVTSAPSFETSGSLEAGVGNYNSVFARGDFTAPISEQVAYSISGGFNQRDGYTENLLGGEDINDRDRWNIRGQLLVEPSDNLSIRFIADYSELDEICCTTTNVENGPTAAAIELLGGQLNDPADPFSYTVFFNEDPINELTDQGISATVEYSLGDLSLTSISAYRENDSFYDSEVDYTGLDIVNSAFSDTLIKTLTQEFRVTSDYDGPFNWLAGIFYLDEDIEQFTGLGSGEDIRNYVDILAGGLGTLSGLEAALGVEDGTFFSATTGTEETFTQDNQAYSLFGQVDFEVTDKLTLTGGLNFTSDEKDVTGSSVVDFPFSAVDLTGAEGAQILVAGGFTDAFPGAFQATTGLEPSDENIAAFAAAMPDAFAQLQAGTLAQVQAGVAMLDLTDPAQNPLLGFQALQFQPPFLAFPNSVESGSSSDEEVTWTLRAAYDVNDNINVYASAGTGFKSTSWNLSRDSRPFASDAAALTAAGLTQPNQTFGTRFAGPEEATVYELGLKAAFNTFAFNATVFDQTIEGFQSNLFTGTGFSLVNAGEQSVLGLEVDGIWSPTEALTLTFAGTFLDPVYDDFVETGIPIDPNLPAVGANQVDLTDEQPAGIHTVSLSTSAVYTHTFANGWSGFVRGEYQYEDDIQIVDNIPGVNREINVVNASLGLDIGNGWSGRVWGRNIFDDEYFLSAFPGVIQAGTINAYPNQPATYGVSVRKTF
ncbi:MAG: TonB-dependent receptor [Pseudomonadota bacterium]